MPVPHISVILITPGMPGGVELAPILSQETNALLSTVIEDPTGTNNFMTGDVSLKGYDVPNGMTVRNYFAAMTPLSMDYAITITLALVPPGSTDGLYILDTTFHGYISPNSVQFEPRTGAFSFTAIGVARKLQLTSAAGLFQRTGYPAFPTFGYEPGYDGKWCLYSDVSTLLSVIQIARVDGVGQSRADFYAGDEIQLLGDEKFTILDVIPDTATPPVYWTLLLSPQPTKNYPAGVTSLVHLLTPYQRSLALHNVVSTLFTAAGFPVEYYSFSAALPNLGSSNLFVSPMNLNGLPDSFGVGIAPAAETGGTKIVVSGPSGAFLADSATSGFTLVTAAVGFIQPPVDATNYGTGKTMFGAKRTRTRATNPRFGLNVTMKFYGYDHLAGNKRYVLTVTCNADVTGGIFTITTALASEIDSGGWVWGSNTPIGGVGISTTTSTDLSEFWDAIGIDVDPLTGTVFFTDIQLVGGAGTPVTMNTSSYQPVGAGYTAAQVTGLNGPIVVTAPGRCVVFQVDGLLGKDPTAYTYTLVGSGAMTPVSGAAVDPWVVGTSLKKNTGDGRYYAFVNGPTQGLLIASWASDSLFADAGSPAIPLQGPPAVGGRYAVDLAVQYGASNGVGVACPMFALVGGVPMFISNTGSGLIPYADMTGLSVADALQQLSILIAGIFYLSSDSNQWNFRSRSHPMPGNTIGINDQIDGDPGFINLVVQPVSNKWVGYVSIANENDATIFGDTSNIAGSIAYASKNTLSGQQTYNLELKTRFVTSSSFCAALANSLYNYLGTQKRWAEVNRFRDGRTYEIGRTFHCNADGANRQFQIIETDTAVTDVVIKVAGMEV